MAKNFLALIIWNGLQIKKPAWWIGGDCIKLKMINAERLMGLPNPDKEVIGKGKLLHNTLNSSMSDRGARQQTYNESETWRMEQVILWR